MVIKHHRDILALIPLIIREKKKFGIVISNIFPISEIYNTHSDILTSTVTPEIIQTFLTGLFSLTKKWDFFSMDHITENNPLLICLDECLSNISVQYDLKINTPSFFLTLDSTYDDFIKKRSRKFRNYLNRMKKKLEVQGNFKYCSHYDYDNILVAYKDMLKIERKSWKHEHGTAITSIKKQESFYELLCEGESRKGRLHLLFLFLNNEPIAYNFGIIRNNIYSYLKTSFSEEYRQTGPSTILRAKLIENLISEGIKYFDFPGGEPYEWEKQWTDELQRHNSLLIYNKTCKAKLFFLYQTIRNMKLSRQVKQEIKYINPKDLKPPQN